MLIGIGDSVCFGEPRNGETVPARQVRERLALGDPVAERLGGQAHPRTPGELLADWIRSPPAWPTNFESLVTDALPVMHGDEVCRTLRQEEPDRRVLMLTAASGVDDLVDGLSLGADDYMPKPFAFEELVARLQALARRANPARPPTLRAGDIELDPTRHIVTRGGREIELTPKEFAVLEALMAADGGVVSNDELVERVWDENADPFTNSVRMTVLRLRRKLGEPPVVETVKGAGYRV